MQVFGDRLVVSVTDLTTGAQCEYALLCELDVKLGRAPARDYPRDAMNQRAATLGEAHEDRALDGYRREFGVRLGTSGVGGVVEVLADRYDEAGLAAAAAETVTAMKADADIVYQASFFDGEMHGRADFLKRSDDGYVVLDTKLARHAKVPALLQLAAYADQVQRVGIAVAPKVGLILGDGTESWHRLADLLPVYRDRRAKVLDLVSRHRASDLPLAWGEVDVRACGRCDACVQAAADHRDVLLVAGLRMTQRERLREHGVATIEQLAGSSGSILGIGAATLAALRSQAVLQVAQDERPPLANGWPDVQAVLIDALPIQRLPEPDAGDIAFDFEGDPLWNEGGQNEWGLEYLFGVVEADTEAFRTFWAHDRAEEKAALRAFLDYVAERRAEHPGMHIYHYAVYEKSALQRLASRHGIGEDEVDELLREGVLVDLYAVVKQSVRVSQPSYSIKKLEPLYMGNELRGEVDDAMESVIRYAEATACFEDGDVAGRDRLLVPIAEYNEYDCVSTLRLRSWLRELVVDEPDLGGPDEAPEAAFSVSLEIAERRALAAALVADIAGVEREDRDALQQGRAMLATAVEYHRRELRPFWWAHFDRLQQPVAEWASTRDVFVATGGRVVSEWDKSGKQRKLRRQIELVGDWGPGTSGAASKVFVIYDFPLPAGMRAPGGCLRHAHNATIVDSDEADGVVCLTVEELLPDDVEPYDTLPLALGPSGPPDARRLEGAIGEVAASVVQRGWSSQPALDLLARQAPRVSNGLPPLPDDEAGAVATLVSVLRDLDRSTLAVQGPPGTGKTHLGARVVRDLVASGWRVGVAAQSHAVVENFLDQALDAGLPGDRIGKAKATRAAGWCPLPDAGISTFLSDHADTGCLLGGTAWDFCHEDRVARGSLDLLVVDEAGQFAVANVVAVSVAAQRMLLLGDPQQLPQVSQGTHPEPVDDSALGWLLAGAAVMPPELGYFLHYSWRMHPELCGRVSHLAYDDQLSSHADVTTGRSLDGIAAGVHVVSVDHRGNAVSSVEEAAEVVRLVNDLLGRRWLPSPDERAGPLVQDDLLVVAAYNAQVVTIRRALRVADLADVTVGTVDKLQGRQAAVVVVSMAASSPDDVPRGMEFLLSRNRVNVAVSRAQWAAYVVRSPRLTDYLPATPARLAELGAFIGLCD